MRKVTHQIFEAGCSHSCTSLMVIEKYIFSSVQNRLERFGTQRLGIPPTPNRAGHFRVTRLSKV